jgi:hypothetical protein
MQRRAAPSTSGRSVPRLRSSPGIATCQPVYQTRNPLFRSRFRQPFGARYRATRRTVFGADPAMPIPAVAKARYRASLHTNRSAEGANDKAQVLDATCFEVVGCAVDQARYPWWTRGRAGNGNQVLARRSPRPGTAVGVGDEAKGTRRNFRRVIANVRRQEVFKAWPSDSWRSTSNAP